MEYCSLYFVERVNQLNIQNATEALKPKLKKVFDYHPPPKNAVAAL